MYADAETLAHEFLFALDKLKDAALDDRYSNKECERLKAQKDDLYRRMLNAVHTDDATWPNGRQLAMHILRGA